MSSPARGLALWRDSTAGQDHGQNGKGRLAMDFLRKLFFVDIIRGLMITFPYVFRKTYTEQYPTQRPQIADRYRGAPRLNKDPETGETLCISCNLCALACPEDLIVVTSE